MSEFAQRTIDDMVAVGATDARSVRLWLRTLQPGPHAVEIWNDAERHAGFVAIAPPIGADGTAGIAYPDDVPGGRPLSPSTTYEFRIVRGDHVVGRGLFETAPADRLPDRFAFAVVSCHQPFADDGTLHRPSLKTLDALDDAFRARDVKRVLLVGDQMYADYPEHLSLFEDAHFATVAPPGRRTIFECTRDEIRSLYQRRYRAFWSIEPFRRLLASYACYPTPDDHEVRDNFGSAPEHASPEWEGVRGGAFDAFEDYQGLLIRPRIESRGSFDYVLRYGDAGVYGLDVRSQRRHDGDELHICTDEQFDALERYLRDEAGALQVLMIVTSVPLAIYPSWVASLGTRILGRDSDAADRWSHPSATRSRRRITAMLHAHQQRNPDQRIVLLGGDIHIGCAVQYVWRDPSMRPMVQFVSSSVSNLTDALTRKLSRIAPHLDPHLHGDADDLWQRIELVAGDGDGDRNPFDGLNVGIVAMTRDATGRLDVTLELLSHTDDTPPSAHTVYTTTLRP